MMSHLTTAPHGLGLSVPGVHIRLDNRTAVSRPLALLDDLGRATRRGIRKCPECGTLNGTRGLTCKNTICSFVFREKNCSKSSNKMKRVKVVGKATGRICPKAFKLVNGAPVHLFSIRYYTVPKRRAGATLGPSTTSLVESYGFVQLPVVQDSDGNTTDVVDPAVYAFVGQCHITDCTQRNLRSLPISSSATVTLPMGDQECCPHVASAIRCMTSAQAPGKAESLYVSTSIIEALPIPEEHRALLALWASEDSGDCMETNGTRIPVVQRLVGTSTLVVRCAMDEKNEFGFVHLSILAGGREDGKGSGDRAGVGGGKELYTCRCGVHGELKARRRKQETPSTDTHCVHFYACLCAFVADEHLATEFKPFIQLVTKTAEREIEFRFSDVEMSTFDSNGNTGDDEQGITLHTTGEELDCINIHEDDMIDTQTLDLKCTDDGGLIKVRETSRPSRQQVRSACKKEQPASILPLFHPDSVLQDENLVGITFMDWLSSVTEAINESMHCLSNGQPEPLVYHISQKVFDCLEWRLSGCGGTVVDTVGKKSPDWTTEIERRDAPPYGTFTVLSWQIDDVRLVQHVFDTPLIRLNLVRNFIQNREGAYEFVSADSTYPNDLTADIATPTGESLSNQRPIRPAQHRTFLKVGLVGGEMKALIVEWLPDLYPITRTGELRIKYEFGVQHNGRIATTSPIQQQRSNIITNNSSPQSCLTFYPTFK